MRFYHLAVPPLEIFLIFVVIYYLLSYFWNTRTMDLLFGLVAFMGIYACLLWFQLPVIQRLMLYFINVAMIGLLIIFQPEIRLALSKLSFKGKKYREMGEFDKFLDSLTQSIYRLADRHIGALILLENRDLLDEYANRAVLLNANFSPELLESIFIPSTPLHDGAVIIRGTTLLSASTILPLADESTQISKSMGTRHRAGLGISQITDAVIIVISEETGRVAIAREGIMTRGIKMDRFKGIIRSIFSPPETKPKAEVNIFQRLIPWKQSR